MPRHKRKQLKRPNKPVEKTTRKYVKKQQVQFQIAAGENPWFSKRYFVGSSRAEANSELRSLKKKMPKERFSLIQVRTKIVKETQ